MDFKIGFMPSREKVSGLEAALVTDTKDGSGVRFALGNMGTKFRGLELGLLNYVGDYKGLQINILGGGSLIYSGMRFGLVGNTLSFKGVDVNFLGKSKDYSGVRLGVLGKTNSFKGIDVNLIGETDLHKGLLKFSALYNHAGELHGIQAGAVNITEKYSGAQIGLFNYAEEMKGVQFSLVNICGKDSGGIQTGLLNIRKDAPWYAKVIPFFAYRGSKGK